jgi:hypothetical protein
MFKTALDGIRHKYRRMARLLLFVALLMIPWAASGQDSLAISFSEETDSLIDQRFIDRYENVFMTKVPTRHMVKFGTSKYIQAVPYPLIDDKNLNRTTLHLGYEFKFLPAFAVALSGYIPLNGESAITNERLKHTVLDAQLRWFFDMRRRMQNGKNANNFTGNYMALFYNVPGITRFDPITGLREGAQWKAEYISQVGLRFGLQRRFLNYGFMDFSFSLSTASDQFSIKPKSLMFSTQASFGIALGDWKKAARPPLCDIFLCDELEKQQWKVRLPDLSISHNLKRLRTGLAYERHLARSWTINLQLDGALNGGVNTISHDWEQDYILPDGQMGTRSIPYALVTSKENVVIASVQPRYYFLQKRQRLLGKGGNGFSGVYAGLNSQYNYYKGTHRFKYLQEKDIRLQTRTVYVGGLVGFQLRLFSHGYLDFNSSFNLKNDLRSKDYSTGLTTNLGIGLAL